MARLLASIGVVLFTVALDAQACLQCPVGYCGLTISVCHGASEGNTRICFKCSGADQNWACMDLPDNSTTGAGATCGSCSAVAVPNGGNTWGTVDECSDLTFFQPA